MKDKLYIVTYKCGKYGLLNYEYMNDYDKVIEYTMTSQSEKTEEKLTKVINSSVNAVASKSNLGIKVSEELNMGKPEMYMKKHNISDINEIIGAVQMN